AGLVTEHHAEQRAGVSEKEVRQQPVPGMDILPAKQDEVLFQNGLNLSLRKSLPDRAAVFVIDDTLRLVEHFPAAFPGHIAYVGVLEIERRKQRVEAAQLEKFSAVESAGAAAAVKAGIEIRDSAIDPMPHPQRPVFPPALRQSGLLAHAL